MAVPEWVGAVSTTINEYVREKEVNVMRNQRLTAMLTERGRITFNHEGLAHEWPVQFKRNTMTPYADGDTLAFSQLDRIKRASLDWRGYAATEAITKKMRLMNRGEAAIVKYVEELTDIQMDDIKHNFAAEFYVDGNSSGNTDRLHGFESALSNSGAATNGYIGTPSDTYAGLVCTLAHYGGTWDSTGGSTIWPRGSGDAHYDFWAPMILDYTDTAWPASTDTWQTTCQDVMNFAIIHGNRNKSLDGELTMFLLDRELYRQFIATLDSKEQLLITKGQTGKDATLTSIGFSDVVWFSGREVSYEYGVPAGVGYGLNLNSIELMSLQDQLFATDEPDYDPSTKSVRFSIDYFGNLKFSPRDLVKLMSIT